jgi:hypothetical protein
MLSSKLLQTAKEFFCKYFPNDGADPRTILGKKIGLAAEETILDR